MERWVEEGGRLAGRPATERWVEVRNLGGAGAILPGPASPSQELSREDVECWVEKGAGSRVEEQQETRERAGEEGRMRWLGERLSASLAMLLPISLAIVEELLSTSLAKVEELLSTSLA